MSVCLSEFIYLAQFHIQCLHGIHRPAASTIPILEQPFEFDQLKKEMLVVFQNAEMQLSKEKHFYIFQ